ncbi:putative minor capsid protein [Loigolactobacillus bifermentans]|uniref:Minor capsid protein n=1 Tax=Loigolactobacillus bifermentans DSM 20003 TaxID=1423726 RepID=A0A0R1GK42_9LACO|nr:putative minor capsid protein [Loigolactobacillus bifermentans]KRK34384.1 hypothetical protein FC07_GL000592 [Loigolactobacillus bifermentans DSM 20003]QGG60088.1 hypothetical protein LB003_06285 [Loigolactobacillus bifermentans]
MDDIEAMPLEMLIHSIKVKPYQSLAKSNWQTGDYAPAGTAVATADSDEITIQHVLIQPDTKKVLANASNNTNVYTSVNVHTLFIDRVNSDPAQALQLQDAVTWLETGQTFKVSEVVPIYTFNPTQPHHWEVTLE